MQHDHNIEAEIKSLRFYLTGAYACNYLPGREAMNIFVDPRHRMSNALYSHLSTQGFRRSGSHVYRPHCPDCRACVPLRVPVANFQASRSQRRILKANADLSLRVQRAEFVESHYRLYRRYMQWRHPGGGMDSDDPEGYHNLFASPWSDTWLYCLYARDRAVAIAITDTLTTGLSAVYTFYEPDLASRGLGTYAILQQIQQAQVAKLPYLYLGYWVAACDKMAYKARFTPHQTFTGTHWQNSPQTN